MRIAVLDDYQRVAQSFGDWDSLEPHEVVFFHEHLGGEDAVAAALDGFEIVCALRGRTRFAASLFPRLPQLRLLVSAGMWNAAIDAEAAARHDVLVCGTPAPRSRAALRWTAELTWGLILATLRKIPAEDRALRAGMWQTTVGTGLAGKTLGILGLGNIGTQVARVGRAFEMRLVAWSQNLTPEAAAAEGAELVSRDELFRQADVLTVHLKLRDRTRGIVGREELRSMKPSAILVNTSRGPVVDEHELASALADGAIAGAWLDVYGEEPLHPENELCHAPNTVLTPHLGYVTTDMYEHFFPAMIRLIRAYLDGEPENVIAGLSCGGRGGGARPRWRA
jgi:phosphoglycerate dehydrogenase-like enzyme